MSGLGQNIHLLHCAAGVHAGGGSAADWGAMMLLQLYWCQIEGVQPRIVETIKNGYKELRHLNANIKTQKYQKKR